MLLVNAIFIFEVLYLIFAGKIEAQKAIVSKIFIALIKKYPGLKKSCPKLEKYVKISQVDSEQIKRYWKLLSKIVAEFIKFRRNGNKENFENYCIEYENLKESQIISDLGN